MTHIKLKLSLAAVVFLAAISYLAFAGMQKGWVYTLGVDSYLASPTYQSQRVRLCGLVADHDIQLQKSQLSARFFLKGQSHEIPVAYKGIVPDLFKAGGEVVVEGKRDASGTFQADIMMTKCASKYEDAPAGHPVHPQPNSTQEARQ